MFYKEYKKHMKTKCKTIRAFGDDIKNGDINMDKAFDEQNKLIQKIKELKRNTKPRNSNIVKEKSDVINNVMALLKGSEMVYNGFESGIFPLSNQPILSKPDKLGSLEKSTSSGHPALSDYSSDYYEYVSAEEKISGRGLQLLTLKQML